MRKIKIQPDNNRFKIERALWAIQIFPFAPLKFNGIIAFFPYLAFPNRENMRKAIKYYKTKGFLAVPIHKESVQKQISKSPQSKFKSSKKI